MPDQTQDTQTTSDRILIEARALFAQRGYAGVSIAQIANALGLTKQALLHHFGTKDRLYRRVMEEVAQEIATIKSTYFIPDDPAAALAEYCVALLVQDMNEVERAALMMRALLDDAACAEPPREGHLKPLIDDMMAMLRAVPGWSEVGEGECLGVIVQLLGVVSYHGISGAALRAAFGNDPVEAMNTVMAKMMRQQVRAMLAR